MKILLCHNYYQQRGGEDQSFEDEAALLEAEGHEVVRYTRHNDDVNRMPGHRVARETLWSQRTYDELSGLLRRYRPDVMHCTNIFPLISPSAYFAAREAGVPVVQALRNYRLLCPKAQFFRADRVCEDCLHRPVPWPAFVHGCYRENRKASAVVSALVAWQRLSRMWKLISRFYALSEFARHRFIVGGVPATRIDLKPNFILRDPQPGTGRGGFAVFVGRLSKEKGVDTLLAAWSRPQPAMPLKIVGDGPMAERVRQASANNRGIEWVGRLPHEKVSQVVGEAACLILPSLCYETFGRTIIEAFSAGTPVLVSRLGAMAELVDDGRTGLQFAPGDAEDLARKVAKIASIRAASGDMRRAARREFEAKYSASANYEVLRGIYGRAIDGGRRRSPIAGPKRNREMAR